MDPEVMREPNDMAQNSKVVEEDRAVRLDASTKKLLSNKMVLAYILKSVLAEYESYPVQEIAGKFIEGEPEVVSSEEDGQDHPDKEKREDKPQQFDIRFFAITPDSGERMQIFVNGEGHSHDTPVNSLAERGMIYLSDIISSQYDETFTSREYGKIRKIVSIWIYEDTADYHLDTINVYKIKEKCLRGEYHEDDRNYDLLTVGVILLGQNGENSKNDTIRLLSKLFSTHLDYDSKIRALQDEFSINVTCESSK